MANIQVKIEYPIKDGTSFTFHAPCNCHEVDGLTVTHPHGKQNFSFKDAHGNDLTGINNLFVRGSLIQVILDVTHGAAFLQNADTNGYLEDQIRAERARIDELVAMRRSDDYTEYPFSGRACRGIITSNGVGAHLYLETDNIASETGTFDDYSLDLPPNFAPLKDINAYGVSGSDLRLDITVNPILNSDGTTRINISFNQKTPIEQGTEERYSVFFPVASPSIQELTDIRGSYDGKKVYATAGEAVRAAQQMAVDNAERMKDFDEDLARSLREIEDLKKNGNGNLSVYDCDDYALAVCDEDGRVVFAITEDGEVVSKQSSGGVIVTDDGDGNVVIE